MDAGGSVSLRPILPPETSRESADVMDCDGSRASCSDSPSSVRNMLPAPQCAHVIDVDGSTTPLQSADVMRCDDSPDEVDVITSSASIITSVRI